MRGGCALAQAAVPARITPLDELRFRSKSGRCGRMAVVERPKDPRRPILNGYIGLSPSPVGNRVGGLSVARAIT